MDFFGLSYPKPQNIHKKQSVPILQEDNFASSIIGLEMEIEVERFTIEDIQTLIKLYSRAVEYYVSNQSNYCIYFQNKIKQLLLRPSVMALIEKQERKHNNKKVADSIKDDAQNTNSKFANSPDIEDKPIDITLKKQGMQLTKNLIVAQQDKDLNKLLKNFKVAEEVKNETFTKALQGQMAELGRKVRKRRQSLSQLRSLNLSKDKYICDSKTADISNIEYVLNTKATIIENEQKQGSNDNISIIKGLFNMGDDSLEHDNTSKIGEEINPVVN